MFHLAGDAVGFDALDFWSWSGSDLLSNATRGALAEFLVGMATGALSAESVRNEWDAYDLMAPEDIRVEVKCSAYIQSCQQSRYSRPVYSIRKSRERDPVTG